MNRWSTTSSVHRATPLTSRDVICFCFHFLIRLLMWINSRSLIDRWLADNSGRRKSITNLTDDRVYRCKQQQTTDRKQTRWVWPAADVQSLIFDLKLHAMCITDQLPFRPSPETTAQSTTRPFQNKSRNFILRQTKRFFKLNKISWSVIKDLTPLCVHHVLETQAFLFRKASVTMVTDCAPYLEKMTEWNFSLSESQNTIIRQGMRTIYGMWR